MATRSQERLLEREGVDSAGEAPTSVPRASIVVYSGTHEVPAAITISGSWTDAEKVTVHALAGATDDDFTYTPSADETPDEVATGLAAVLDADALLTASAGGNRVSVLAAGGEVEVELSNIKVEPV